METENAAYSTLHALRAPRWELRATLDAVDMSSASFAYGYGRANVFGGGHDDDDEACPLACSLRQMFVAWQRAFVVGGEDLPLSLFSNAGGDLGDDDVQDVIDGAWRSVEERGDIDSDHDSVSFSGWDEEEEEEEEGEGGEGEEGWRGEMSEAARTRKILNERYSTPRGGENENGRRRRRRNSFNMRSPGNFSGDGEGRRRESDNNNPIYRLSRYARDVGADTYGDALEIALCSVYDLFKSSAALSCRAEREAGEAAVEEEERRKRRGGEGREGREGREGEDEISGSFDILHSMGEAGRHSSPGTLASLIAMRALG